MSFIGRITRKVGIYNLVRYSPFYPHIQKVRNPAYFHLLEEEEAFYRMLCSDRKVDLIFDVGANLGDKAEVFSRIAHRVICFEPEPRLAQHLRRRFRHSPQIVIEECGLSDREGLAELHAYEEGSAYNTFSTDQHKLVVNGQKQHQLIPVAITTLDAMIAKHGTPQLLKVDVEGHENEVFSGLSTRIGLISYEANLPDFAVKTCVVARRLGSMAPNVRFGVGGSGRIMTGDFPLTTDALCQLVSSPVAPSFLEVFVKLSE